nr:MAG TPA: hypothetical protein [Caudoviricetes sp.]
MLEVYQNEEFGAVRAIEEGNKVLFCATDVARALGYSNQRDAVGRHCKGVVKRDTLTSGGTQELSFIPEGDVYRLIIRSNLPSAEKFEHWVFDDVLPSIRKHGLYAIDDVLENPDLLIKALTELKKEREEKKRLELENAVKAQQIAEMQPKVSYYDIVLACPDLVTITQIAKDFGLSAKKLNKILKEKKIQFKQGRTWFLYQKYAEQGYTQSKTYLYDEDNHTAMHTLWTQKGRLFIYELLKADGILPVMEQE